MEHVTSRWHLCLSSSGYLLEEEEGGWGEGCGEHGKQERLFQWQVIGRESHRAFVCLFVYTYISDGIAVLVFNDV